MSSEQGGGAAGDAHGAPERGRALARRAPPRLRRRARLHARPQEAPPHAPAQAMSRVARPPAARLVIPILLFSFPRSCLGGRTLSKVRRWVTADTHHAMF